jgi:small neutral amino acid transporter SnatA (MarC family)
MKKITIESLIFVAGLGAFCAGLWLIYPPASLVGGGLILMFIAIPGGKR